MILLIDNFDSFSSTLESYLVALGADVCTLRCDKVAAQHIDSLSFAENLEGIVISPGPGHPSDYAVQWELVRRCMNIPLLGVCLGHQIIASAHGAQVCKGQRPMHGQVTKIHTEGRGLFTHLERSFSVTRYHSLVVSDYALPRELRVDARAEDGAIMAISHKVLPIFGVQFHPEALLTENGHELLAAFLAVCAPARCEAVMSA